MITRSHCWSSPYQPYSHSQFARCLRCLEMAEWDDSLILACYEKAVSEHETREKGKKRNRVLQSDRGEPGPWQTYNRAEEDERRQKKAHALYVENKELNKPFFANANEAPPSSSSLSTAAGTLLDVQIDEAMQSMMMSW